MSTSDGATAIDEAIGLLVVSVANAVARVQSTISGLHIQISTLTGEMTRVQSTISDLNSQISTLTASGGASPATLAAIANAQAQIDQILSSGS